MMYYYSGVVLDETPKEISLCFKISGCDVGCIGCHDKYISSNIIGNLTESLYVDKLKKHIGKVSCVLFMGGEWHCDELLSMLLIAKSMGFKTAMYTGRDKSMIHKDILCALDYIKYGKYDHSCGGLQEDSTNQVYEDLSTGENLTYLFQKK